MSGFFFKSVVQLVLLFGAETWLVTHCMGQVLGVSSARQLTGQLMWRRAEGNWEYTLAETAIAEVGLEMVETYSQQRQNMVTQ